VQHICNGVGAQFKQGWECLGSVQKPQQSRGCNGSSDRRWLAFARQRENERKGRFRAIDKLQDVGASAALHVHVGLCVPDKCAHRKNEAPGRCARCKRPLGLPSTQTSAASIAAMGGGKLTLVTRRMETGTVTTLRSSSSSSRTACLSGAASANTASERSRDAILAEGFILKIADGGWKTPVLAHVRVSLELGGEAERDGLDKELLLKQARGWRVGTG
jgi:hypothetical protein